MDLVSGFHGFLVIGAHVRHDTGVISRVFRVHVSQFQIAVFRHETYNKRFCKLQISAKESHINYEKLDSDELVFTYNVICNVEQEMCHRLHKTQ